MKKNKNNLHAKQDELEIITVSTCSDQEKCDSPKSRNKYLTKSLFLNKKNNKKELLENNNSFPINNENILNVENGLSNRNNKYSRINNKFNKNENQKVENGKSEQKENVIDIDKKMLEECNNNLNDNMYGSINEKKLLAAERLYKPVRINKEKVFFVIENTKKCIEDKQTNQEKALIKEDIDSNVQDSMNKIKYDCNDTDYNKMKTLPMNIVEVDRFEDYECFTVSILKSLFFLENVDEKTAVIDLNQIDNICKLQNCYSRQANAAVFDKNWKMKECDLAFSSQKTTENVQDMFMLTEEIKNVEKIFGNNKLKTNKRFRCENCSEKLFWKLYNLKRFKENEEKTNFFLNNYLLELLSGLTVEKRKNIINDIKKRISRSKRYKQILKNNLISFSGCDYQIKKLLHEKIFLRDKMLHKLDKKYDKKTIYLTRKELKKTSLKYELPSPDFVYNRDSVNLKFFTRPGKSSLQKFITVGGEVHSYIPDSPNINSYDNANKSLFPDYINKERSENTIHSFNYGIDSKFQKRQSVSINFTDLNDTSKKKYKLSVPRNQNNRNDDEYDNLKNDNFNNFDDDNKRKNNDIKKNTTEKNQNSNKNNENYNSGKYYGVFDASKSYKSTSNYKIPNGCAKEHSKYLHPLNILHNGTKNNLFSSYNKNYKKHNDLIDKESLDNKSLKKLKTDQIEFEMAKYMGRFTLDTFRRKNDVNDYCIKNKNDLSTQKIEEYEKFINLVDNIYAKPRRSLQQHDKNLSNLKNYRLSNNLNKHNNSSILNDLNKKLEKNKTNQNKQFPNNNQSNDFIPTKITNKYNIFDSKNFNLDEKGYALYGGAKNKMNTKDRKLLYSKENKEKEREAAAGLLKLFADLKKQVVKKNKRNDKS
ncbi:hypothetical protein EDEG_05097 [Edhazardia aedis USNM 41457]|uniref:Uncharacterized protein n=1 Tax=Edhazardia aedis (strain USNM 41457) TaxID=1003232 RepID=A0A0L1P634_EDHAE|nr:hypothetical protein EDEG_05097 [Edhazardia aedis USNM 41457]|eukprot:KNH48518.1 hypothetical protein EDEG_05097 [Edhazardia aedis USNM 41457]